MSEKPDGIDRIMADLRKELERARKKDEYWRARIEARIAHDKKVRDTGQSGKPE